MTYITKETLSYRHEQCDKLRQRIAEIDEELAQVYDGMWQCEWGDTRRLEQLTARRNALEQERNNKERELETYL